MEATRSLHVDVLGRVVGVARRGTSVLRGTVLVRGASRCIDPRGKRGKGYLLRVEGRKTWQGTPQLPANVERDGIGFCWPNARRKEGNVRLATLGTTTSFVRRTGSRPSLGGMRNNPFQVAVEMRVGRVSHAER